MKDIIQLLPDHVANQIAAGEVVQRPSSAVKELLENSIDAGADDITLVIRDGGKTLIRITDNGKGMSETDARMCWERHATSKISRAEDLFAIRTFGFRGEAMASIAAVAQVELRTRRQQDELGTCIQIEGSVVKKQEPVQTPVGSTISVKNLFYNIPARRNFLRSTPVETRHIMDEFQRVALAHPGIKFTFLNNDNEVYRLEKTGRQQRIADIFSLRDQTVLLEANEDSTLVQVDGFVGKPESSKKTRGEQFFFVNSRYIRDPYLHHAVMNAFEGIIPKENFPLYVLFIDIDPARIDVNVHPGKTEIKFEDERSVYIILQSVVKKALGNYTITPDIDGTEAQTFNPVAAASPLSNNFPAEPQIKVNKHYDPFGARTQRKQYDGKWQELFEPFKRENTAPVENPSLFQEEQTVKTPAAPERVVYECFQAGGQYLVAQTAAGLLVIDQQAAHQRILYEKFIEQFSRHQQATQQLLFPRTLELSAADFELVVSLIEDLRMLGFDINEFGKNSVIINGTPPEAGKGEARELLEGLLEQYKLNMSRLKLDKHENMARSMAYQAAVKRGTALNRQEMIMLAEQLLQCHIPAVTPAGNPTFITFAENDLAAWFNR